jgi:hypothetical protein
MKVTWPSEILVIAYKYGITTQVWTAWWFLQLYFFALFGTVDLVMVTTKCWSHPLPCYYWWPSVSSATRETVKRLRHSEKEFAVPSRQLLRQPVEAGSLHATLQALKWRSKQNHTLRFDVNYLISFYFATNTTKTVNSIWIKQVQKLIRFQLPLGTLLYAGFHLYFLLLVHFHGIIYIIEKPVSFDAWQMAGYDSFTDPLNYQINPAQLLNQAMLCVEGKGLNHKQMCLQSLRAC